MYGINKRPATKNAPKEQTTEELVQMLRTQIDEANKELVEVQREIQDTEKKIRDDDLRSKSEIDALTYQRDTNRKEYQQEISAIIEIMNSEANKLKIKHEKELEYVHNELRTALQNTEDFVAKFIISGDFNDKHYRFTHAKKLSEKYTSVVDSIDTAISKLVTQRNQQVIAAAGQIEDTINEKKRQQRESNEANQKFKQQIVEIEKIHKEKMDQISRKYQKEREQYEKDINKQIFELKTTEEMYQSIANHNREKIKEVNEDITRLRMIIAKSSLVPKEDESKSYHLFEEFSKMEEEINELRGRNAELKQLISEQDSFTRLNYSAAFK